MELSLDDFSKLNDKQIYTKYMLGQNIWYFKNYLKLSDPVSHYDLVKEIISENLNVHFNNIAIVGSAKNGYSLSPKKRYSKFNEKSDIDIILVSRKYYEEIWNAYLDLYYDETSIPNYIEIAKGVFKGFVTVGNQELSHPVLLNWIRRSEGFILDLQVRGYIEHDIKYRIYRSWEDVDNYHLMNVKILKQTISNDKNRLHRSARYERKVRTRLFHVLCGLLKKKMQDNDCK